MLIVSRGVLEATFTALRRCGGGRSECVAYWVGNRHKADAVDAAVQPDHVAGPRWYDVETEWVTKFFLDLRRTGRTVRAQVHTHPGSFVEHSLTDDAFAIAPHLGFVSIVLPNFALGPITLQGAYLTELSTGGWQPRTEEQAITWT